MADSRIASSPASNRAPAPVTGLAGQPLIRNVVIPVIIVLLAAALAYLSTFNLLQVGFILADLALVIATWWLARSARIQTWIGLAWIVILIGFLVGVKIASAATLAGSVGAGGIVGWLGISYLVFRLLHVTFDARNGKVSDATLSEMIVYCLHPASLIAGPIDRLNRSMTEQRRQSSWDHRLRDGIWRIFLGAFKKLALANSFYAVVNAYDMTKRPEQSVVVAWVWLVAYAFYLYFDFAGYCDIALGAGRLMGIRLPENFAAPYGQPNLSKFWQAWHITLSQWFRDYLFFPLSRTLLKRTQGRFQFWVMLISQLTTMIACGLWHGISWNFVLWGAWHGIGLFVTGQVITLWRRLKLPAMPAIVGVGFTFLFVTVGWVFFASPTPDSAVTILRRLVGG